VFVHSPLQYVAPAGHAHTPATQVDPPVQATPQPPQWLGSVPSSTQAPWQSVWTGEHAVVQMPLEQTAVGEHDKPQPPQALGFEARSTHAPPQNAGVTPWLQPHTPATQA
jgi:hypothetical protein